MAEKTIVEKAAEAVGYGIAMAEDVAGSVKTAVGAAVTTVTGVLTNHRRRKPWSKRLPKRHLLRKLRQRELSRKHSPRRPRKKPWLRRPPRKALQKRLPKKL